jgi:hypothetical protein
MVSLAKGEGEMKHKEHLVDDIINFEEGNMDDETMVEFFQKLIDTGLAWELQGSYGRTAQRLIEAGHCFAKGAWL